MRLSQICWFLSADKAPSAQEIVHYYSHLNISPDLRKFGKSLRLKRTIEKRDSKLGKVREHGKDNKTQAQNSEQGSGVSIGERRARRQNTP